MDNKLLKALYVILISLALAFIFNFLFFEKQIGISVFIFNAILLAAAFLFGLHEGVNFKKSYWLVLPILFFALMSGIRANEFLTFLNVCATLGLLFILSSELTGTPAFLMKLRDYFKLIIFVPFRMLGKAFSTISFLGKIHSTIKHRDVWIRVTKGVILALPILIIFAVLFSLADLAFSKFLGSFVHITISVHTVQYLVVLAFSFILALSFLSFIFFKSASDLPSEALAEGEANDGPKSSPAESGKSIEVLVFLGLISALFLVFIGFQITYLFGGESNIINAGFTYAEYARRGFWELLVVAILSLLILLASEKYSGSELKKDKRFLIPALFLIAEVIVVIFSAFKRLSLYIDAYSLTMLRFYVAGFIILLLVLFILLAVKFIKNKPEEFFTFGTLLCVIAFLVTVNIINPDAFIIRSNIKQYNETGKIDVSYVRELSADSVPWEIELYNKLQGQDKETLGELLQKEKDKLQKNSSNWQSANLSRSKALNLLQDF